MTAPPMLEADLQRAVTDLAAVLGWQWAHFRPAQTSKGWRTPVSGPLGKGWPDLVLFRPRDRRFLAVELKRTGGKTTPDQDAALDVLRGCGVESYIWRPDDLDSGRVLEVLR